MYLCCQILKFKILISNVIGCTMPCQPKAYYTAQLCELCFSTSVGQQLLWSWTSSCPFVSLHKPSIDILPCCTQLCTTTPHRNAGPLYGLLCRTEDYYNHLFNARRFWNINSFSITMLAPASGASNNSSSRPFAYAWWEWLRSLNSWTLGSQPGQICLRELSNKATTTLLEVGIHLQRWHVQQ